MEYVEIKHLQAALCPTEYGASTVKSKLHGRLFIKFIATPLKNDSMKSSGISEEDSSELNLVWEYVELRVVYYLAYCS